MRAEKRQLVEVFVGLLILCDPASARWTEPVPVAEINTDTAEEWSPFLSFDRLTMYFARVRSDVSYYGRIFQATREEPFGPFTFVTEIPGQLNSSTGHVASPWVSPDNLRMYYHTEYGGTFRMKVSERTSADDPWPAGVDIQELNELGYRIQMPTLTPDELTVFFSASDIPGGKGGYDIWIATRFNTNLLFESVKNLERINTAANELHPFVSPDGLTLYFASNRNGNEQLFKATRVSLDTPFDNPEHLSFFDTPSGHSAQPCLSSDGKALYFVKHLEGQRELRDIYVAYFVPEHGPQTYYVDAIDGNDLNNGLSLETAIATIQKGIILAEDGDTILVYPGVYTEEIRFGGKAIKVRSAADAAVLENPDGLAVCFYDNEGSESVLENFVVKDSFIGLLIMACSPTVRNLTIVNNDLGIIAFAGADSDISNCIFWNNTEEDLIGCQARFSCLREPDVEQGNISMDPLFVDPNNGDYHLRSERGRYWPEHDVWVLDDVTSPCIDAGDPNVDYSAEPTPNCNRINMGAYGGTAYASMSEWPTEGDVNRDGKIDIEDIIMLVENWLRSAGWLE
jgi:hypothetical protein